jgi:hypothetical protein
LLKHQTTIRVKHKEKIDVIQQKINENNLSYELETWRTTGNEHAAKKDTVNPPVQLCAFMREWHNDIKIPSAEFYDRVQIKADEEAEVRLGFVPNNKLVLALSGGRSRKRRRQYRNKKSRSRK